MARRSVPEVNAGSMADIAFLLLIFFLVTTDITSNAGIAAKLPPKVPKQEQQEPPINERNLFVVLVNKNNQLLVEDQILDIKNLRQKAVEFLAVDMGAMGDDQQTDEYTVSVCVKDGSGPYNFDFRQHLVSLCKEKNIPFKLDIYPYYGSDASAAMRAGAEVKHALLCAGIESSHSYERTHLDSVEATQQLVDAYLLSSLVEA